MHRSLPELDGTLSLPELKQEVLVERDQRGIPRVQASSLSDLLVAQGYVLAQDRLWQMDLLRRVAAGELAEIFGPAALSLDRQHRTLGLRQAAERAVAELDPETRVLVEAYASGVNRYIEQHRNRLPLEFTLLRYRPRPWTPADTFLISGYMYEVLTTTWKAELGRAEVVARVGPEQARDLYAGTVDSPFDHFIVGGLPSSPKRKATVSLTNHAPAKPTEPAATAPLWPAAQAALDEFGEETRAVLGSNNFVVSGEHTYSGKPLLANDTHLPLAVPCIWYIVHLVAPDWNVKGFALPGAPLVMIGHNQRIAWGFTNNMADVQDLYIETFNPQNPDEYLVNGSWKPAEIRRETIAVKGAPAETLEVAVTRHGPVVARAGSRGYALRWTALEPGGLSFAWSLIGRAQNWAEFRQVMRGVSGPAQNGVYADVDGNIGYLVAARIPIRKSGDGSVPVPGDTDAYEWTGYIPFDQLPQVLNPPGGVIATANARVVGPAYRWYLTDRWGAPYRTERMYELLEGRKGLRPADCLAVQTDVLGLPDRFLGQQLLRASQNRQPQDPQAHALLVRLKGWDGQMLADSVLPSFVSRTREALLEDLLRPYLDGQTRLYDWWRAAVFVENILRERPTRWLPSGYASYDDLLIVAADQAVNELRQEEGASEKDWHWGRVDALWLYHPLGRSRWLRPFLSVGPVEHGGSSQTVDAISQRHGPAMRFVADLADWDNSMMEITLGESGQYGSPYFRDQFPAWRDGRAVPAPFSQPAEDAARVHRLRLDPAAAVSAR